MQLMSVQPSLVALGGGVGGGGGLAAPGTIGRSCSANEDITLYSTLTLLELGDVNNEDGDEARATEGAVGVGVVSGGAGAVTGGVTGPVGQGDGGAGRDVAEERGSEDSEDSDHERPLAKGQSHWGRVSENRLRSRTSSTNSGPLPLFPEDDENEDGERGGLLQAQTRV